MSHYLILWDVNSSVSVLSAKEKGIIRVVDDRISFNWPKLGEFNGTILEKSGLLYS